MLVKKEKYMDGKLVFHAFLVVCKPNSIVTTLPFELLKKRFQRELFHLENALIIGQKMANRMLEEFSELILQNEVVQAYFFPNYILQGVNIKTAEQVIHLQDNFELTAEMCFSERLNSIEFFHIQQRFLMAQKYITRTANKLNLDTFTAKYLTTDTSKFCFRSYLNEYKFLLEFEDEGVECAFVLNANYQLKMFISI
ncbi:MAG: hypothetical protein J0G96_13515 [Flavobacteriia bacterium]|nr:hypothetical protein [Flavobacteriia bacterium]